MAPSFTPPFSPSQHSPPDTPSMSSGVMAHREPLSPTSKRAQHLRQRSSMTLCISPAIGEGSSVFPTRSTVSAPSPPLVQHLTTSSPRPKFSNSPSSPSLHQTNWKRPQHSPPLSVRIKGEAGRFKHPGLRQVIILAVAMTTLTFVGPVLFGSAGFATELAGRAALRHMRPSPVSTAAAAGGKLSRPMPLSTHPRIATSTQTTFAEYLNTRLGGGFSLPLAPVEPSQLWLSVGAAAPELRAFIAGIDEEAMGLNLRASTVGGKKQTRSKLVELCGDDECLVECDGADGEVYCFGEATGERGEMVAAKAALAALEQGRKVMFVNGTDTYFKVNPLPLLGDLSAFHLQVPVTTSRSLFDAPFVYLSPSTQAIAVLQNILQRQPSGQRKTSTNPLLDAPSYSARPTPGPVNIDLGAGVRLDVNVLSATFFGDWVPHQDHARFRSTYFRCPCCTSSERSFIASSLGYLTSTVKSASDVPNLLVLPQRMSGTFLDLQKVLALVARWAEDNDRKVVAPRDIQITPGPEGDWRPAFEAFAVASSAAFLPWKYIDTAAAALLKIDGGRQAAAQLQGWKEGQSVSVQELVDESAHPGQARRTVALQWPLAADDLEALADWQPAPRELLAGCDMIGDPEKFSLRQGECLPVCRRPTMAAARRKAAGRKAVLKKEGAKRKGSKRREVKKVKKVKV